MAVCLPVVLVQHYSDSPLDEVDCDSANVLSVVVLSVMRSVTVGKVFVISNSSEIPDIVDEGLVEMVVDIVTSMGSNGVGIEVISEYVVTSVLHGVVNVDNRTAALSISNIVLGDITSTFIAVLDLTCCMSIDESILVGVGVIRSS
jgi:hypothetical protein